MSQDIIIIGDTGFPTHIRVEDIQLDGNDNPYCVYDQMLANLEYDSIEHRVTQHDDPETLPLVLSLRQACFVMDIIPFDLTNIVKYWADRKGGISEDQRAMLIEGLMHSDGLMEDFAESVDRWLDEYGTEELADEDDYRKTKWAEVAKQGIVRDIQEIGQ